MSRERRELTKKRSVLWEIFVVMMMTYLYLAGGLTINKHHHNRENTTFRLAEKDELMCG